MSDNMFRWELGEDRVLVLVMDTPGRTTNTMTDRCVADLQVTVQRLVAEKHTYDGVVLTSAKETFFAGGDLNVLMNAGPDDVAGISAGLDAYKAAFRVMETLGKPVVAAINGTALGGGFEFALATHHRIALDRKGSLLGLPEVTFGVLPGAGGLTRVVRMLGVVDAFTKVVGQGQKMSPDRALEVGIVDQVVATEEEMLEAARTWIRVNPDAVQPWDRPGYTLPGGTTSLAGTLSALPASVRRQVEGSPMPAPRAVLSAAVEGAQVDIEAAFALETRYCADLICGQVSTNMIKALFFDLNSIARGASRPEGFPVRRAEKVAVLGAGMMGAAIAYVVAQSGAQVVLRDVTLDAAEAGKDYSRRLLDQAVASGRITQEKREQVLGRILATQDVADVKDSDFVIEAVFEDLDLKKLVLSEIRELVADDALIATNTSALPLAGMATAVERPADFIGLHFFSPVDRMPLLEIVVAEATSDATLARAFDFAQQIRKTPIAVKDVYAFYANRVITQYIDQAMSLLAEGVHPASIEQAAVQAGFPVGPLALLDEVNLRTTLKIQRGAVAAAEAAGTPYIETPGTPVQQRMVEELDRPGRLAGRGFYDYAEDGTRLGLWPQLVSDYAGPGAEMPFDDVKERMLVAGALEAVRCYEDGIVRTVADANIGSIYGIGFPLWTGGALQYVSQYDGGLAGFVGRADELREKYGERFAVPDAMRERVAAGGDYR